MDIESKNWEIRIKLILGWLCLVPVWLVTYWTVGVVDKTTSWVVSEWILIGPALITIMMLALTVYYLKVRREVKRWKQGR